MHTRRILGCLLLAAASLLAFSQIYTLFTMPEHPMLPNFRHDYVVSSSIEIFSYAIPAILIGLFMLRSRARYWLWFALIIAGAGLWLFVIRELWLHYYDLPHRYPHFAAVHPPYFTGPLWWLLVRLSWHITLPAAFILAMILILIRAPNKLPEPN
jgi:uncharacterized membrane protein YozB (DUF420 family)